MTLPPPPWTTHNNDSCFWIEDGEGRRIVFVYFKAEPDHIKGQLSREEARAVAEGIARLPEMLGK